MYLLAQTIQKKKSYITACNYKSSKVQQFTNSETKNKTNPKPIHIVSKIMNHRTQQFQNSVLSMFHPRNQEVQSTSKCQYTNPHYIFIQIYLFSFSELALNALLVSSFKKKQRKKPTQHFALRCNILHKTQTHQEQKLTNLLFIVNGNAAFYMK